jgi:hypothetical protein
MSLPKRVAVSAGVLAVAIGAAIGLSAQPIPPGDHLTGTWILNVPQSKYVPADMAPKSGRSRITVTTEGIKVTTDGMNAKGEETHAEYTAKLDGKDYPWKGTVGGKPSTEQDAVSWKKIDEWTYENTAKLKGKVLTVSHVVISKDGKTRTNTVTGTNAQGQTVNSVVKYDKQ